MAGSSHTPTHTRQTHPRKYYWQATAQDFNCAKLPTCQLISKVGTFTVTR